ncbi:AraC family transcriptional regulator [uncultured Schumannella sp.]|uniref:AraC family transcriptional regulator n=1 Tax=uncultured Schumannella sp. TaxID=1195956 RepID=UPI0025E59F7A|nr:AraC family transcriptional regulator [uncultured Schumannella sp.]
MTTHHASDLRTEIRDLVARHAPGDGVHQTPLDGVRLFRVSSPVERVPGVYDPSVCVVVAGSKHAYHDSRTHTYDPDHYLCATMPTPLEAEVPVATTDDPVLGVLIDLESRTMAELLIAFRAARPRSRRASEKPAGLIVADWDHRFETALLRALQLLDEPVTVDILGPGRLRELLYTVLDGPAGGAVLGALGGPSHELTSVLTYMRSNLDQPLAIEDLAERAGMSRAAFDRHFKATTSLSPLKYLKSLRLNDAAMLITNGAGITRAAARVGYTSASQFSREFKSHFGTTPRDWANSGRPVDVQASGES